MRLYRFIRYRYPYTARAALLIAASLPLGERIEITADFCQCPACREARCDP